MAKIIQRAIGNKKRGAALLLALLQLTVLTFLSLVSFIGGPQSRDGGTRAETPVSAPQQAVAGTDGAGAAQADQAPTATAGVQTITAKDLTPAQKNALRKSAHFAKKLYEPLAS
jgi:hypothetical protein